MHGSNRQAIRGFCVGNTKLSMYDPVVPHLTSSTRCDGSNIGPATVSSIPLIPTSSIYPREKKNHHYCIVKRQKMGEKSIPLSGPDNATTPQATWGDQINQFILSNASNMTTLFPRITTVPMRTFSPASRSSTASSSTMLRKTS